MCVHVCMHACMHICVCVCVCMYVCMCVLNYGDKSYPLLLVICRRSWFKRNLWIRRWNPQLEGKMVCVANQLVLCAHVCPCVPMCAHAPMCPSCVPVNSRTVNVNILMYICTEFMKTLFLMEATLAAENEVRAHSAHLFPHMHTPHVHACTCAHMKCTHVHSNSYCLIQELLLKKEMLQLAIRKETEIVEEYKVCDCRISCDECRMSCDECRMSCDECRMSRDECRMSCDECRMSCDECLYLCRSRFRRDNCDSLIPLNR